MREAVNVQPTCRQDEIDSLLFFSPLLPFSAHLTTLARSGPKQTFVLSPAIEQLDFDANSFDLCVRAYVVMETALCERHLPGRYGNLT